MRPYVRPPVLGSLNRGRDRLRAGFAGLFGLARHARFPFLGVAALAAMAWSVATEPARAQLPGVEAWAESVSEAADQRSRIPRVPGPTSTPRPRSGAVVRSSRRPLAVHATMPVSGRILEGALQALELAYDVLREEGWAHPWPDGGRGNTVDFDLYLQPTIRSSAHAHADPLVPWTGQDGVSTWAEVDPRVSFEDLPTCVAQAYAEALLLSLDPGESSRWRKSTASWMASRVTGWSGCPVRPPRSVSPRFDRTGFVSFLDRRYGAQRGQFVQDLWNFARQKTADPAEGLRAEPDLWAALDAAETHRGGTLETLIEDYAVERWLNAHAHAGRNLDSRAAKPVGRWTWADLPVHSPAAPALAQYGSTYLVIDVSHAPAQTALQIWFRGEYGVRWSVVAARLDRQGRVRARLRIPPGRKPDGYLAVELLDDSAFVIVVVTNLANQPPQDDAPDVHERSFRIVFDSA